MKASERGNRCKLVLLSFPTAEYLEIVAWRITLVTDGTLNLDGVRVGAGVVPLGGAYDTDGRPVPVILSGTFTGGGNTCNAWVEYSDPKLL